MVKFLYHKENRELHRTTQRKMNRKEFFKTAGRLLILGGITTSAGYLLVNKKVTAKCSVSPTCENCGKFQRCNLPQAEEVKGNMNQRKTP